MQEQKRKTKDIANNILEELKKLPNEENVYLNAQQLIEIRETYKIALKGEFKKFEIQGKVLQLLDIKIQSMDLVEDRICAMNSIIYNNIRRGLTIMDIDNQKFILRKGLKKFFDIDLRPLRMQKVQNIIEEQWFIITFKRVLELVDQGNPIRIEIQEKVNGENAQISYSKIIGAFVICSKGVAMILRSQEQLIEFKQEDRYKIPIKIATEWFKLIENHPNLELLKETLDTHTLIGEYCGTDQHLVEYKGVQLRFYAMVEKSGEDTCINTTEGKQFIKQMGFKCVGSREYVAQNREQFNELMQKVAKECYVQSMEEAGEGNVVYFSDVNSGKCLSLGKLKTIDYIVHRIIREQIKTFIKRKENISKYMKVIEMKAQDVFDVCGFAFDLEKYMVYGKWALHCCEIFLLSIEQQKEKIKATNIKRLKTLTAKQYIEFFKLIQDNINVNENVVVQYINKNEQILDAIMNEYQ